MSEVTEIMPCPFCGELPVITKHFKHEMFSFMHRCPVLGPISRDFRETAQGHIDMWNTRSAQVELAALREELAGMEKDRDFWRKAQTHRLADCQEMMKALQEIEGCKDVDAALLATDTLTEIFRRAEIKPTESGASE